MAGTSLPVVTGINPASGAAGGGNTVTVTGTGFTGATSVLFGSVPGTNLTVVNETQLTVTSPPPPNAGVPIAVTVTVTTPAGTSATPAADQFTYAAAAAAAAAPTVTGISPTSEAAGGGNTVTVTGISPASGAAGGGNTVTVTGTGFTASGTSVLFGSVPGTKLTFVNETQLTVTSPPPPNASVPIAVTVRVITPAGTSATPVADQFTYVAATALQQRTP
jgi:hypothetical protein